MTSQELLTLIWNAIITIEQECRLDEVALEGKETFLGIKHLIQGLLGQCLLDEGGCRNILT